MGISTMRAAVIHKIGPADSISIEQVPVPRPLQGEVLVRVTATTVNHVDTFVRSGAYRTPLRFPFVIGRDLVGVVEATASDVTRFHQGDEVWCNSLGHHGRQGSAAEFACVPQDRLYRMPHGVDPVEFVAVVHPAATAWLGLVEHGRLTAGDTAFVGGGAGNVGACAVAFALSLGSRVVTTVSGRDLEQFTALGAVAIDSPDVDAVLTDALIDHDRRPGEASPHSGADVWFDTSGTLALPQAIPLLAERGRIVLISGIARHDVLRFGDLYTHDRAIVGFAISNATTGELTRAADAIGNAAASGTLPTPSVARHPLEYAAEAHADLEAGRTHRSRLVLVP